MMAQAIYKSSQNGALNHREEGFFQKQGRCNDEHS